MDYSFLPCLIKIETAWGNLTMLQEYQFEFNSYIDHTPKVPGIYRFFDQDGRVIYVGKAVNLNSRLKSYSKKKSHRPDMEGQIARAYTCFLPDDFSTYELEYGIYKKYYLPYFNKSTPERTKFLTFVQIPITTLDKEIKHRDHIKQQQKLFGPFLESRVEITKLLQQLQLCFKLPDCGASKYKRRLPCDTYHNQRCDAPCYFAIDDYPSRIKQLEQILHKGKKSTAYRNLTSEQQQILDPVIDHLPAKSYIDSLDLSLNYDLIKFNILTDQGKEYLIINLFEVHQGMILDIRNLFFNGNLSPLLHEQSPIFTTKKLLPEFVHQTVILIYQQLQQQRKFSQIVNFTNQQLYILNNDFDQQLLQTNLMQNYPQLKIKHQLPRKLKSIETLADYNAKYSLQQYLKIIAQT